LDKETFQAFLPDSFIDIIESSMGALFDLSTEVEQVIKEGESEVIECEGFYKQDLTNVFQQLEICINNFETLVNRVKNIAGKTVYVGDRLESINSKVDRARKLSESKTCIISIISTHNHQLKGC
jgi:endonuclease IV